jgi:hypothetical protein
MPLRALLLIAASCLAYQLLLPPVAGVADNGDFQRLVEPFGIDHVSQDYKTRFFDYVDLEYRFVKAPEYWRAAKSLRSSEMIPIAIAVALNNWLSKTGEFDLRLMGILHAGLFLLLLRWMWPLLPQTPRWRSWLIGLAALGIFLDAEYACYFNSFYAEPMVLLTLLGLCGACLHAIAAARLTRWNSVLLVCFAALFVTAKAQTTAAAVFVAPLVALMAIWFHRGARVRLFAGGAAAFLLLLAGLTLWVYPVQTKHAHLYFTIFIGILGDSQDKRADLASLGLDPGLVSYSGVDPWSSEFQWEGGPLDDALFNRIDFRAVTWFYFTHPARFLGCLNIGAPAFYHLADRADLGQLQRWPRFPPRQPNRAFRLWSRVGFAVGEHPWAGIGAIAAVVLATFLCTPGWQLRSIQIFLAILAVTQFLTAVIGEGASGIAKHLYVCDLAVDLLLLWSLVHFTGSISRWIDGRHS